MRMLCPKLIVLLQIIISSLLVELQNKTDDSNSFTYNHSLMVDETVRVIAESEINFIETYKTSIAEVMSLITQLKVKKKKAFGHGNISNRHLLNGSFAPP